MERIFLRNIKYRRILPSSFLESEFEKLITLQAPELYPDYFVVPFKKTVISPHGSRRPDLVFIARDYKDWYVVEVEMTYHSYDSHVEPQIHSLTTANYDDPDVLSYLCKQCKELDYASTAQLIHLEPPKILLILNELKDDWAKDLGNKYGVITSVFEVFHTSELGAQVHTPSQAYGISYNYPVYSVSVTTQCSMHPQLTYLGVNDNSSLQLRPNDEVVLEFNGCVTFWKAVEGPNKSLWLKMQGRDGYINRNKCYQITKLRDDSLFLFAV